MDEPQDPLSPNPDGNFFGVSVVDFADEDEEAFADSAVASQQRPAASGGASDSPRRRGRPTGSRGRVIEEAGKISLSDMAFLRAQVQGISLRRAAEAYLMHEERIEERSARAYTRRLLLRLQRAARALRERELALQYLAMLNAPLPAAQPRETLEQFAERFDPDMYSEAELQELFEEEYGQDGGHAGGHAGGQGGSQGADTGARTREQALRQKLEVLAWLHDRVAVRPENASPISDWTTAEVAKALRERHGLMSLGQLVLWLNDQGRSWYHEVPGLGRERAQRLLAWLWQHEELIQARLSPRLRAGLVHQALPSPDSTAWFAAGGEGAAATAGSSALPATSPPRQSSARQPPGAGQPTVQPTVQHYALVPLENLAWPAALSGADGLFRGKPIHSLAAHDDADALRQWEKIHLAACRT